MKTHPVSPLLVWIVLWGWVGSNPAGARVSGVLEGLDPLQLALVVVAPRDVRDRLSTRVRLAFERGGLPLNPSSVAPGDEPSTPTLKLTIDHQALHETCLDKVLYIWSLELIEPVVNSRNSLVWADSVWSTGNGPSVRTPVTLNQMEADVDALVERFITTYRLVNPEPSVEKSGPSQGPLPGETSSESLFHLDPAGAWGLAGLALSSSEKMEVSVLAGRFSQQLRRRAVQYLADRGLPVSVGSAGDGSVTLGVEFIQQSVDEHCPGKVLYEAGVYLVEEVRLRRNPQVRLWTDTWSRNSVQVVGPRSIRELEADEDALLDRFIEAMKAH